jgi:hypothetical protein
VAPKGSDAAPGTAEAPFATLTRARDAVRAVKKAAENPAPVRVVVHGGTYEMLQTLELEPQDSGTAEHPVIYRAAAGETPLLIGALPVAGFVPHEGKIMKADVSKLALGKAPVRQLLFNGERQPLARYPNVDPKDLLYGGWAFLDEMPEGAGEGHQWKREAYVKAADVRRWSRPEDVELFIFPMYGWWNFIEPVKALDAGSRKLTLARDCGYDLHPHNRYFFQNALEELDAPGEWYLDRQAGLLYFWPPAPLEGAEVRIPVLGSFVVMKPGLKHVTVEGLSFLGSTSTAVVAGNTEHCTIQRCHISHCGGHKGAGISVHGGRNNMVSRNVIAYTGSSGIGLGGGDRQTLVPAGNRAENNHIHHMGVIDKNAAGVQLSGVGNAVSNNHIHHGPRMGIQFSGNNLRMERNHIHHVMLETQDGGAVYTGGRDWISSRGTVLKHNFIHDVVGVGQEKEGLKVPWFSWGIYMDDNAGGLDIVGNIVARCSRASLHLHNGRDHHIENNIFIEGGERQMEFNGWRPDHSYIKSHMPTMIAGWEKVKDEPAWQKMRGMKLDPRDAFFPDETMMSGNVVRRNIVAWTNPSLRYVDLRNCTAAHNVCDENVVWNGGEPVRTAVAKAGANIGEELLKGGGQFSTTAEGTSPKGWGWNHRPDKGLKSVVTQGVLVTDGAVSPDPKNPHSVIHSPYVPFKAGAAFRARFRVRSVSPEARVSAALMMFEGGKGYWEGPRQTFQLTPEWQTVEITGTLPKEGETQWKEWMSRFCVRFDFPVADGKLEMAELLLHEAEPMDEWTAWQSEGWDKKSVVADPLFENAAGDDYRLKAGSPAWKLGFERIPVEQIGVMK